MQYRKYAIIAMIYSAVKLIKMYFTLLSKWLNTFIEFLFNTKFFIFFWIWPLSYSSKSFYFNSNIHYFFSYSVSLKTEGMSHYLCIIELNLRKQKKQVTRFHCWFICDIYTPFFNKKERCWEVSILYCLHSLETK